VILKFDVSRYSTLTSLGAYMAWRSALVAKAGENGGTCAAPMVVCTSFPAASSDVSGPFYLLIGSAGSPDELAVCVKASDNTYSWVSLLRS
jgi:hypothetical protein